MIFPSLPIQYKWSQADKHIDLITVSTTVSKIYP